MPEPTPEAWAQIRHAYEHTDKPLAHICAEHDVTIPTVRYRMKRWGWTRRKPLIPRHGPQPAMPQEIVTPPVPFAAPFQPTTPVEGEEPSAIGPRLQAAVARVLPAIEATIARLTSGTLNTSDLEKAGRTLATLTRTLRELNALLVQNNAPLQPDDEPLDIDAFRNELARRIRALIAERQNGQDAQPGQAAVPESQDGYLPAAAMDGPARA